MARTFEKPGLKSGGLRPPVGPRSRRHAQRAPLWDPDVITPTRKGETYPLFAAGVVLGFFALLACNAKGYLLLYGDAVAHLGIARRIVDSHYPGLGQLGGVWLPLPHVLMLPFIAKLSMWQTGMAAVPMSLVSYAASVAGMWRLGRRVLRPRWAFVATLFYALNPNLLYLSATAMTEALFLALFVWTVIAVVEGTAALHAGEIATARARMVLTGFLVMGQVFTRYDGWIIGAAAWAWLAIVWWRSPHETRRATGRAALTMTMLCAAGPLLWFWYNAHFEGDWLDFMRGPYSARAIEARTSKSGQHYPGWHNPLLAAVYFLRAAQLDASVWETGFLLLFAALGGTWLLSRSQPGEQTQVVPRSVAGPAWGTLLLWAPLPFYMYSIAFGSVPIFVPQLQPHAFYNVRYGMELLPALSLFAAAACEWGDLRLRSNASKRAQLVGRFVQPAAAMLCVLNALGMMAGVGSAAFLRGAGTQSRLALAAYRGGYLPAARRYTYPLMLQEGIVNAQTRVPFERALADLLAGLPPDQPVLMSTSAHVGAVQGSGRTLRSIVSENDEVAWKAALADPARRAAYVIAMEGDPVEKAVAAHPDGLVSLEVIRTTGQPAARVYRSDLWATGKRAAELCSAAVVHGRSASTRLVLYEEQGDGLFTPDVSNLQALCQRRSSSALAIVCCADAE